MTLPLSRIAVLTGGLAVAALSPQRLWRGHQPVRHHRRRQEAPPPPPPRRTSAAWTPSSPPPRRRARCNVIALPPRLGELRRDHRRPSSEKYGIKIEVENPTAPARRDQRGQVPQGPGPRPRRRSTSAVPFALQRRRSRACFAPVQGRRLRQDPRRPEGRRTAAGTTTTAATSPSAATPSAITTCPHDLRGPAQARVQGQGRAQRQPDQVRLGLRRRLRGGPGQRRLLRRHPARHRLLRQAEEERQLHPGRVHPGHRREGRDARSASTGTTSTPATPTSSRARASTGRSPSRPTASTPSTTRRPSTRTPRTRPPPACGRSTSTAPRARTSGSRATPARSCCPPWTTAGTARQGRRRQAARGRRHARPSRPRTSRPRPRPSSPRAGARPSPDDLRHDCSPAPPARRAAPAPPPRRRRRRAGWLAVAPAARLRRRLPSGSPLCAMLYGAFTVKDPATGATSCTAANLTALAAGRLPHRPRSAASSCPPSPRSSARVLGLLLAQAVVTSRFRALREAVLTASGVLANFGGVPLAFAFVATLGNSGVAHPASAASPTRGWNLYTFCGPGRRLPLLPDPADGAHHRARAGRAAPAVARGRAEQRRHRLAVLAPRRPARCSRPPCSAGSCCSSAAPSPPTPPPRRMVGSSVPLVTLQIADALSGNVLVGQENVALALSLDMIVDRRPGDGRLPAPATTERAMAALTAASHDRTEPRPAGVRARRRPVLARRVLPGGSTSSCRWPRPSSSPSTCRARAHLRRVHADPRAPTASCPSLLLSLELAAATIAARRCC